MGGRGGRIHSASPGGVKRVDFGERALQRATVAGPRHDRLYVTEREQAAERDLRERATQLRQALAGHHRHVQAVRRAGGKAVGEIELRHDLDHRGDRKSTRLNSSHLVISYAVFCLKKKKKTKSYQYTIR